MSNLVTRQFAPELEAEIADAIAGHRANMESAAALMGAPASVVAATYARVLRADLERMNRAIGGAQPHTRHDATHTGVDLAQYAAIVRLLAELETS